jgi:hypothetical protein
MGGKRPPAAAAAAMRRLYLQLTVARPAQMLMLVSAQQQLMPITTLSALTTLQSTATTFIIKKVATVHGVRWRRACIMGRGPFWSCNFMHFFSQNISERYEQYTSCHHEYKKKRLLTSTRSGLDFLNNNYDIQLQFWFLLFSWSLVDIHSNDPVTKSMKLDYVSLKGLDAFKWPKPL